MMSTVHLFTNVSMYGVLSNEIGHHIIIEVELLSL